MSSGSSLLGDWISIPKLAAVTSSGRLANKLMPAFLAWSVDTPCDVLGALVQQDGNMTAGGIMLDDSAGSIWQRRDGGGENQTAGIA